MPSDAELFIRVNASSDAAMRSMQAIQGQIDAALGGSLAEATSQGQKFTNALDAAQPAGMALAGIGAGIVGGLGLAVDAAADFEAGMSGIKAVSGATEEQMNAVRDAALQLGADTAFSAGEAAAGFEELIKGGLSIEDALAAAKPMLDLAAAGEIGVADAAEIAANAIGIFNLQGSDMENVSNQIAGAANASSLSVTDFKFSMSAAGSVAAGVGQTFDDLATAIAIMGKNGLKGSDAGTSLKTMLMNLQPTTDEQIQLFEQLGLRAFDSQKALNYMAQNGVDVSRIALGDARNELINFLQRTGQLDGTMKQQTKQFEDFTAAMGLNTNAFVNADGSFKSMAEIAGVLQTAMGGLSDAQRAQALETMFGSDAIRAANIFVKEGTAGFNEMAAAMGNVTAADVGAEKMNNLRGVVDALKGSLETVAIVAGSVLLPPLRSLAEWVTGLVNRFMELSPGMQQVIVIGTAVAGVFASLLGGLILLGPFLASLPAAFAAIGTMAGIVGGVIGGPVVLAIGALVAAGALLYTAWQSNWGGIQQIVAAAWGVIQNVFNGLYDSWLNIVAAFQTGGISGALTEAGLAFQFFGGAVGGIIGFVITTIGQLVEWIGTNLPGAIATLSAFWTGTLLPAITAVWGFISQNIIPLFQAVAGVYIAAINLALTAMAGFWQNVLYPALQIVASYLQTNVGPALNVVKTALQFLGTVISTVVGPAIGWFVTNILSPLWGSLQKIGGVFGAIISGLQGMAGAINNLKLPAWLTPGSPTPLETGLYGVLSAVQSLSRAPMPAWMAGGVGTLPAASFQGTTTAGGTAAGANMGLAINITQNPDGSWSASTEGAQGIGNLRLALNEVLRS